jgi:hypothetical protein
VSKIAGVEPAAMDIEQRRGGGFDQRFDLRVEQFEFGVQAVDPPRQGHRRDLDEMSVVAVNGWRIPGTHSYRRNPCNATQSLSAVSGAGTSPDSVVTSMFG